ncbi:hypothetical protein PAEVO_56650 [Paenibacillus sp. GM2FR]|nr:hypothetical protein PAEVO_56650 [Paenibacillus sp. GM2FR]
MKKRAVHSRKSVNLSSHFCKHPSYAMMKNIPIEHLWKPRQTYGGVLFLEFVIEIDYLFTPTLTGVTFQMSDA